ncbi:hypothetical protein [Acidocella facilis]|uniref:hypothetical protein n=1 Tax=Acidocella facilis TaxID=525 RepID=UPI001F40C648|nr:hypothetical protein [Acidocella facilis]
MNTIIDLYGPAVLTEPNKFGHIKALKTDPRCTALVVSDLYDHPSVSSVLHHYPAAICAFFVLGPHAGSFVVFTSKGDLRSDYVTGADGELGVGGTQDEAWDAAERDVLLRLKLPLQLQKYSRG